MWVRIMIDGGRAGREEFLRIERRLGKADDFHDKGGVIFGFWQGGWIAALGRTLEEFDHSKTVLEILITKEDPRNADVIEPSCTDDRQGSSHSG